MSRVTFIIFHLALQCSRFLLAAHDLDVLSTYKIVFSDHIPVSSGGNFPIVGAVSAMQCATKCNDVNIGCRGFVFKSSTCMGDTSARQGSCELLTFTNPGDVTLRSSTSRCQRFYVVDPCPKYPCMNGGMCDVANWPDVCTCFAGFNGMFCEDAVITIEATGRPTVHSVYLLLLFFDLESVMVLSRSYLYLFIYVKKLTINLKVHLDI